MSTALLVIDVQRGLCTGEYAMFESDRVIDRLNAVSRKARAAGVPVVFVQHEEDEGMLLHGGAGWQLADGLEVQDGDLHVRKKASDSFHQTDLERMLQARGVDRLVVGGMQSDFCVDSTVRRALALGFSVVLVSDGHSTMDNGVLSAEQISRHHTLTLSNLGSYGPQVEARPAGDVAFAA